MSKIEVNQISSQCGSTLTIGQSGDTVTLACGATQSGFGRTGTVDWDTTAKTAGFTAVSGNGYFVNTTSGAITVTLPAGSAGSIVSLKDYANTWNTNNVTVTPNGTDKINGINANATLNTQDQSITLVYVDSTKGWRAVQDSTSEITGSQFITATGGTITTSGDYKIHTFTGPGTFCVTAGAGPVAVVDYLVVAGGAAGAPVAPTKVNGGGGGAGGFRESSGTATGCYTASPLGACVSALPVTITGYPITVGAGGSTTPWPGRVTCAPSRSGSNSIFSTITSTGGGAGGAYNTDSALDGGSGGGAGHGPLRGCGGAGNTPPVSPPQGANGGNGSSTNCCGGGGGGGGALQVGSCGVSNQGADGGDGATTNITASPVAYAGGGGGGGMGAYGIGGTGGGGDGARSPVSSAAVAGTANTGGGGGGGSDGPVSVQPAQAGGSGIVVIRYKYQ